MPRLRFSLRFLVGFMLVAGAAVPAYRRMFPPTDELPKAYSWPINLSLLYQRYHSPNSPPPYFPISRLPVERTRTVTYYLMVNDRLERRVRNESYSILVPPSPPTKTVIEGFEWRRIFEYADVAKRELKLTSSQVRKFNKLKAAVIPLEKQILKGDEMQRRRSFGRSKQLKRKLYRIMYGKQVTRLEQLLHQVDWRPRVKLNPKYDWIKRDWYDELVSPLTELQRNQIVEYIGASSIVGPGPGADVSGRRFFIRSHEETKAMFHDRKRVVAQLEHRIIDEKPSPYVAIVQSESTMNLKDLGAVEDFQYFDYLDIVLEVVLEPPPQRATFQSPLSEAPAENPDRQRYDLEHTLYAQLQAKPPNEKQIRRMIREIEEKLTADQKQKIEEKCIYRACVNRGIYASLMDGELNRRLTVTPDQRKEIKAIAITILKRMDDRKHEQTVLAFKSSILDLPVESRQEVRDMMGPCVRW